VVKKGYATEHEREKYLKDLGWFTLRSSGSMGPIDIVAIKCVDEEKRLFEVRLEQVKHCSREKYIPSRHDINEMIRCAVINKFHNIPVFWVVKYKGSREWEEIDVQKMLEEVTRWK
jgi:Holliday junction resolvase